MSFADTMFQPGQKPVVQTLRGLRPQLKLLRQDPRSIGNTAFGVLLLAIAAVILGIYLTVQTALSQGAYQERTLTAELTATAAQAQALQQQNAVMSSAGMLAKKATSLGMVEMVSPVFISLKTGKIEGEPSRARYSTTTFAELQTLAPGSVNLNRNGQLRDPSQIPSDDSAVAVGTSP